MNRNKNIENMLTQIAPKIIFGLFVLGMFASTSQCSGIKVLGVELYATEVEKARRDTVFLHEVFRELNNQVAVVKISPEQFLEDQSALHDFAALLHHHWAFNQLDWEDKKFIVYEFLPRIEKIMSSEAFFNLLPYFGAAGMREAYYHTRYKRSTNKHFQALHSHWSFVGEVKNFTSRLVFDESMEITDHWYHKDPKGIYASSHMKTFRIQQNYHGFLSRFQSDELMLEGYLYYKKTLQFTAGFFFSGLLG